MQLEEVVALSVTMLGAEQRVARLTEELKEAKAYLTLLTETTVPCALQELGLTSLTLDGGQVVALKPEVYASVSAERMPAVVTWLEAHQADDIVKREVSMRFSKEEGKQVQTLVAALRAKGLAPEVSYAIHAGTLKAFIKERLANALPIDLELFGARAVFIAKIINP